MQSDVLSSLDREGSVVVMIMLHLSAASDSIDREFPLSRRKQALAIIGCYLSDRLQRVNIKGTLIRYAWNIFFCVLQRSVFGPILYFLYSKCLMSVIDWFTVAFTFRWYTAQFCNWKERFSDKLSSMESYVASMKWNKLHCEWWKFFLF